MKGVVIVAATPAAVRAFVANTEAVRIEITGGSVSPSVGQHEEEHRAEGTRFGFRNSATTRAMATNEKRAGRETEGTSGVARVGSDFR